MLSDSFQEIFIIKELQISCLFLLLVLTQWTECNNPLSIGNGQCDNDIVNKECNYDGLECCPNPDLVGNGQCNNEYQFDIKCNYDGGDCCVQAYIGKYGCQNYNNFASCGNFDGGDCA